MVARTLNTAARQQVYQADRLFPGGGERISVSPMPREADLANIRYGGQGDILNVPWMQMENRRLLQGELANYRTERFDRSRIEDRQIYSRMISRSLDDNEVRAELAAYRLFELRNEILASTFALGAFQQVNLNDDEQPVITKPGKRQRFTVRYTGQDGQARRDQFNETRSMTMLGLRMQTTDKVEYPLFDIQTGNIQVVDKIDAQLRQDMEWKLDIDAQANLDAGKTVSGLRDLLDLHPAIVTANVPDTNYLDLTSIGTAGVLDITKIKMILSHIAKFGVDGITPDGGFTIQSIVMSPQNMQDWWDFVVGSSRVDLQACKLEYSIVSPK